VSGQGDKVKHSRNCVHDFHELIEDMYRANANAVEAEVYADPERYPHRTIAICAIRPSLHPEDVTEIVAIWIAKLTEVGYFRWDAPRGPVYAQIVDSPDM
jgi:hypothetical protein